MTLREFHLFNQLPAELRVAIWELAILEHNRDRLILVNEHTNRIMCTKHNACSPHFSVSSESRDVARSLYPIRLPVFSLEKPHPQDPQNIYVDESADLVGRVSPHAVYISSEHDIFVPGAHMLIPYSSLIYRSGTCPPGGPANWAWRTPSLLDTQCRGVRRVALFDLYDMHRLPEREEGQCQGNPFCVVANRALERSPSNITLLFDNPISHGAREHVYAVGDPNVMDDAKLYAMLLENPGREVLASFCADGRVVRINEEKIKLFPHNNPPGCLCILPQRDSLGLVS